MVRVPPSKPSKTVEEDDPKLETFKEPNLDSIDSSFGNREERNLNAVDQSPAKDSESVVCDQTKVKTSVDPPLDFSFKDSVAGFDSLDWFWRTPSFEQLRVELSEEPLDLYLKDSFNSIASLRHVYVATEPEWVVSEPFVPVSCATVNFNETEVKKRDDQKDRGEMAKKKTPNDEILSISSSRRAEEKKSDDEEDKDGDDKRVEDSLRTKEATMSKASKVITIIIITICSTFTSFVKLYMKICFNFAGASSSSFCESCFFIIILLICVLIFVLLC